jgi:hypothetical protein
MQFNLESIVNIEQVIAVFFGDLVSARSLFFIDARTNME